jgi:ankyrin repeat protein
MSVREQGGGGGGAESALDLSKQAYEMAETGASSNLEALLREHKGKVDLNLFRNIEGETALHCVCLHTDEKTVRLCIEHGARINAPDNKGETPLHKAARRGRAGLVRTLLELNATTDATDGYGGTALHSAANAGHADCCRYMLESNADSSAENSRGKTARFLAYIKRYSRVVQVIDNHNNKHGKNLKTDSGDYNHTVNPAALALSKQAFVLSGRSEGLFKQFLVGHPDCNVNLYRNEMGFNALHRASASGKVGMMQILLEHKADICSRDNQGNTALHRVACNGGVQALRFLLDAGAEIDAVNKGGHTARHLAAQRSNANTLLAILDSKSKPQSSSLQSNGAHSSSVLLPMHQHMSLMIGGLDTAFRLDDGVEEQARINERYQRGLLGQRSRQNQQVHRVRESSVHANGILGGGGFSALQPISRPGVRAASLDRPYRDVSIGQWSCADVLQWAADHSLEYFLHELKEQDVDGSDLMELNSCQDVLDCQLTSKRVKGNTFMNKIKRFKQHSGHMQASLEAPMPKCVVCNNRPVANLFLPCAHLCLCVQCKFDLADALVACPMCHKQFERIVTVSLP